MEVQDKVFTYTVEARTRNLGWKKFTFQTGDTFTQKGKSFIHKRKGQIQGTYTEKVFNEVFYSKDNMALECPYPVAYRVS